MGDNVDRLGTNTRHNGWNKVADPATGWLANKTGGWTADSFSGGLTVDFSSVVPAGTRAVRVFIYCLNGVTTNQFWYRAGSDSAISNTPGASSEESHHLGLDSNGYCGLQCVVWLSSTYTADFAVNETANDLYVAYPVEHLL